MNRLTDKDIIVAFAKTKWRPYRDSFEGGDPVYIAVVVPGGFSGFGDTADKASNMALSRATISLDAAKKKGASFNGWLEALITRATPNLASFVESLRIDEDWEGHLIGETDVIVRRGESDRLPDMAINELVTSE